MSQKMMKFSGDNYIIVKNGNRLDFISIFDLYNGNRDYEILTFVNETRDIKWQRLKSILNFENETCLNVEFKNGFTVEVSSDSKILKKNESIKHILLENNFYFFLDDDKSLEELLEYFINNNSFVSSYQRDDNCVIRFEHSDYKTSMLMCFLLMTQNVRTKQFKNYDRFGKNIYEIYSSGDDVNVLLNSIDLIEDHQELIKGDISGFTPTSENYTLTVNMKRDIENKDCFYLDFNEPCKIFIGTKGFSLM